MSGATINRRGVIRLAMAALGGLVTGAMAGCADKPKGETKPPGGNPSAAGGDEAANVLLGDPHVCRGINQCKNKGKKDTMNECAGQATCATVAAHDCNGMNDCKGKGGCHVPLMDGAWDTARKAFEFAMNKNGKEFGKAPAKKSSK